jgi:hypothetical protein
MLQQIPKDRSGKPRDWQECNQLYPHQGGGRASGYRVLTELASVARSCFNGMRCQELLLLEISFRCCG